jgi:large subunit ribosomal protein L10
MDKSAKEAVVKEVGDKIKRAATSVLTDYRGLTVHQLAELRRELGDQGIEYKVYKNTLVKRAIEPLEISELADQLNGPTAIAFGFEDAMAAPKLLTAFAKKNKALSIKGGLLEGRVLDAKAMRAVATLPPKEILLGQLVGLLQSPIRNLAYVLNAPIQGLAIALRQVAEQKQ